MTLMHYWWVPDLLSEYSQEIPVELDLDEYIFYVSVRFKQFFEERMEYLLRNYCFTGSKNMALLDSIKKGQYENNN